MNIETLQARCETRFGSPCAIAARAPGRVNLIGEHTDYNEGFVLPIATQQETWVGLVPRDDDTVRVFSANIDNEASWPLQEYRDDLPHWTSYIAGVIAMLRRRDLAIGGCDLFVTSTIPPGGGLSSSAALEVACALALARYARTTLDPLDLIDVCRQAEHEFAGVPCGIMDQSASLLARAGAALLLDCRSREIRHIPCLIDGHAFVIADTGVRHKLAAGEYARRQEQCARAVAHLRRCHPHVRALRDVTPDMLDALSDTLDPVAAARARHVVTENQRTRAAAEALRNGRLAEFGRLMDASHRSLRDQYQVSCAELDQLVEILRRVPGVLGARMTGGGFGGCVVALVTEQARPQAEQAVAACYHPPGGETARLVVTRPGRGASLESP